MKPRALLPSLLLIGCTLLTSGCVTSWCLKTENGLVPLLGEPVAMNNDDIVVCTIEDFLARAQEDQEKDTRLFAGCNVVGNRYACYGCDSVEENGSFEFSDPSHQEPGFADWSRRPNARTRYQFNGAKACVGTAMLLLPRSEDGSSASQIIDLSEDDLPSPAVMQASVLVNRIGDAPSSPLTLRVTVNTPGTLHFFSETLLVDNDPDTWEVLQLERFLPENATELNISLRTEGEAGATNDHLFDYVQVAIGSTPLYDLALDKRALDADGRPVDTLAVSSPLVYEVILTNLGPDPTRNRPYAAHRIIVRDELPFNLTTENPSIFEAAPEVTQGLYTFDEATRTLQWTLDRAIAPGATDTLRMVVRPNAPGSLLNEARIISGRGGDPDSDNDGASTRTVIEAHENSPPVATSDEATTTYGTPVEIDVLANDFDPDGDPITIIASSPNTVEEGTTEIINNGQAVRYTPATGFTGTDTFNYVIADSQGSSSLETPVTVVVAGANSAPVVTDPINDFSVNVDPPESCVFPLNTHFDDPDGDRLSYTYTRSTNAVTVDILETNGSAMTVTGSSFGQATVTVTAQDPGGLSVSDTFEVNAALATDCASNSVAP